MKSFRLAEDPYRERKPSVVLATGIVLATIPLGLAWFIAVSFTSIGLESADPLGARLWMAFSLLSFELAVALPGAFLGHVLHLDTRSSLVLGNALLPLAVLVVAFTVGGPHS